MALTQLAQVMPRMATTQVSESSEAPPPPAPAARAALSGEPREAPGEEREGAPGEERTGETEGRSGLSSRPPSLTVSSTAGWPPAEPFDTTAGRRAGLAVSGERCWNEYGKSCKGRYCDVVNNANITLTSTDCR